MLSGFFFKKKPPLPHLKRHMNWRTALNYGGKING